MTPAARERLARVYPGLLHVASDGTLRVFTEANAALVADAIEAVWQLREDPRALEAVLAFARREARFSAFRNRPPTKRRAPRKSGAAR